MAKVIKAPADIVPPAPSNLRTFFAKGVDGLTSPEGVQYNSVDGVIELPVKEGWYSLYIDCGWLEEKLG